MNRDMQGTQMTLATQKYLESDEGKRTSAKWEDPLNTFFCNDSELIDYIQEVVGMVCFGRFYIESMFIAIGDGSHEKSTFWNTIEKVMGTYAGKLSPEVLTTSSNSNKAELATLKGKRLVIMSETEEEMPLSSKMLQTIASTDKIRSEEKFKAPFDFTPQHTAILYTNFLPTLNDRDNGTLRRLGIIPFNARISDKGEKGAVTDIKNFASKLFEESGPAILAWLLQGAQLAYQANFNFEKPDVVKKAEAEYQDEYDWLKEFLNDCAVIDGDFAEARSQNPTYQAPATGTHVLSRELYDLYTRWAKENGEKARSHIAFNKEMAREGFTSKRVNNERLFYGLDIRGDKKQR